MRVDYSVKRAKTDALREIYLKEKRTHPPGFKKFIAQNQYWIEDYALYKALKLFHEGAPWYEWDPEYKNRDNEALASFKVSRAEEMEFELWVQWRLYMQFLSAKEHAGKKGVLLKGDLPILISRDSADVWAHPGFFKLEFFAGAPPDMYCAKGQRWGMPTYNWKAIADEGYTYIKEKLKYAENFYDILRVDHVVGLFRIWSIPADEPPENEGLNGSFDPPDEKVWKEHGEAILSVMTESTEMLLCAEDLGVVPKECPAILKKFGIPGNDVQRWVKDWQKAHDFLPEKDYRPLSVAMLSTHDTTNWAAWWENEAGTVDEALFIRKCSDHRAIGYERVKDKLFDPSLSRHGRLRWLKEVSSVDILVEILGRKKEELLDFIEIYQNTYMEKEKLWRHMGFKGTVKEKCDSDILEAALKITLNSSSVFAINLIFDWLMPYGILAGDPYRYRVNTPGTVSEENWSLVVPRPLEDLIDDPAVRDLRSMIKDSGRA
jgi:4-alpha-glucanotransferase